ncbi:MAG: hypothetical protein U1F08_13030 [Steroidobacteraceae bacterium]
MSFPMHRDAGRLRAVFLCSLLVAGGLMVAGATRADDAVAPVADATAPAPADPAAADPAAATRGVDQDVQALKKELVALNRDLFKLEEEILYPASTQVAVFLSVNTGTFFQLDSVTLKLDDKEVANYLYTTREIEALHRGGVQKLYIGNLKAGPHELVAFFTGKGPHDVDYRRGATLTFDKTVGAKYVELRITDKASAMQPEFVVRQWE